MLRLDAVRGRFRDPVQEKLSRDILGRTLKVSFIGVKPYIVYSTRPVSGSDIDVLKILSKKFGFGFELRPERTFDVTETKDGRTIGLIHSVVY